MAEISAALVKQLREKSGAGIMDLRISGATGVIKLNDFLSQRRDDHAGVYQYLQGWGREGEMVEVPSEKPGAALMFQDFSALVADMQLREASIAASEQTQEWLDAIWNSALENENGGAS